MQLVGHELRRHRLKSVFEGRKKELAMARFNNIKWSELSFDDYCKSKLAQPDRWNYSNAVIKYTRARKAWRAIRGWN